MTEEHSGGPAQAANLSAVPPAQRPINAAALSDLEPCILEELKRIQPVRAADRKAPLVGAAVKQAFARLFGPGRSSQERALFFTFVAPRMRRIMLERAKSAGPNTKIAEFGAADVERWLAKLETVAPLHARMIDLHYFAGLSEHETAAVLGLPARRVIRDIRFVRAWLSSAKKESN